MKSMLMALSARDSKGERCPARLSRFSRPFHQQLLFIFTFSSRGLHSLLLLHRDRNDSTLFSSSNSFQLHTFTMKLSLYTLTFLAGTAVATWGTGGGGGDDGDDNDNCEDYGDKGGWKRFLNGRTWGHGGGDKDCTTKDSGEHTKTHGGGGGGGEMTYSTIYATQTHTITSCAPDVDDCPGEQYTTVTVAVSTTLCPVTQTQPIPVETPPVAPPPVQTTPIQTTPIATPPAPPVVPPVVPSGNPSTPVVVPPVPTTPATLSTRTSVRPTASRPSNGTTTATRPPVVTAGAASNGVGAGVALAALLAAMV